MCMHSRLTMRSAALHTNYLEKQNNKVYLQGEVVTNAIFSHEVYGEGFYEMNVSVKRLSGQTDILPVTISERLIAAQNLGIGSQICAVGQFRSYNKVCDGKSRLMLTVFVRELWQEPEQYRFVGLCMQTASISHNAVQQGDYRHFACGQSFV